MAQKSEAFLDALETLCRDYQICLYVGGEYDEPHLILEDLVEDERPFRRNEVEDLTTWGNIFRKEGIF
jgi:hypothetical protein